MHRLRNIRSLDQPTANVIQRAFAKNQDFLNDTVSVCGWPKTHLHARRETSVRFNLRAYLSKGELGFRGLFSNNPKRLVTTPGPTGGHTPGDRRRGNIGRNTPPPSGDERYCSSRWYLSAKDNMHKKRNSPIVLSTPAST